MAKQGLNAAERSISSGKRSLTDATALVTGASSGIGRAIVISLAQHGVRVCAVGKDVIRLGETARSAEMNSPVLPIEADLAEDRSLGRLEDLLVTRFGRLDILVHSAGMVQHNRMANARVEDFDSQYALNVRMPYLLTKTFLSMLKASGGQVVFINSTLGINAKRPEVAQFAASQHAMRAIADSLREEVNADGIRVLSVYPGRTATPRQERLYREEGKAYRPDLLMQPEDVAAMVVSALCLPRTAEVTDIHMRPMRKSY
ncbi:MAG: SDR family NAD(P)-dependent oxidoreductase [Candidatus Acidiferrales bacterium]